MCLIQTRKGPNNCFKRFCWTLPYLTSVALFQIFLHPKIPVVINNNAKNAKKKDFLISSIISTVVNFKSFMLFSYLLQCVLVTCNEIGFKILCFQMYGAVLSFFALINRKNIIKCVLTNKMVWNERMAMIKHVHII